MIKRFVILRRIFGLSIDDFRKHWEDIHAPLFSKVPGVKKYTQYHVTSQNKDDTDDPIDGIAEIWFDSDHSMKKAFLTDEYKAVLEDAITFMGSTLHFVHPVIVEKTVDVIN